MKPSKPARKRSPAGAPGGQPPSASGQDYLERIHELTERHGVARVADIAAALGVRRPSVTAMVQKLARAGYLDYTRYRGLVLTGKGRRAALEVQQRHVTLKRFLGLLGLDEATAEHDIEGLEHSLSPQTLRRLARLLDYLETRRETLQAFLSADSFSSR
jgi:Mn-dependent DtxR family transcriptional regulator